MKQKSGQNSVSSWKKVLWEKDDGRDLEGTVTITLYQEAGQRSQP